MNAWEQIVDVVAQELHTIGDVPTMTRVTFRMLMALAVGGALGYERESKGKSAGLRTHMLVSLGAATIILAPLMRGGDNDSISRVIQGLVAGIGFLGAGAIVKGRQGHEPQGLTTATTIWMAAALGLAVGLGRAGIALVGVLLSLIILRLMPSDLHSHGNDSPPADDPPQ